MKYLETNRQRRRGAGFGMVEVLVTLVLLSVGLMGIAKLQLISLRSVHASKIVKCLFSIHQIKVAG